METDTEVQREKNAQREREQERDRQTDRQTDRWRQRETIPSQQSRPSAQGGRENSTSDGPGTQSDKFPCHDLMSRAAPDPPPRHLASLTS